MRKTPVGTFCTLCSAKFGSGNFQLILSSFSGFVPCDIVFNLGKVWLQNCESMKFIVMLTNENIQVFG